MRLNNKGMSVVEIVLTFALIMMITTGLLMIVVNYRNKVSVSVERLTMDTFKNNITQDLYKDMLDNNLIEINEYSESNLTNLISEVKLDLKRLYQQEDGNTGVFVSDSDIDKYFDGIHSGSTNVDGAVDIVKRDLANYEVKVYTEVNSTDYKNIFANAIIRKAQEKFGSCLTLSDLNRCLNIKLNVVDKTTGQKTIEYKAFGTGKIIENSRDSLENKFLYYDGIKYKIKDNIPKYIPKDKDGNARKLSDLQRIQITDDGILDADFTILEDGTKLYVYRINVGVYHIDFREDFGIHIVVSTDDVSM